LAAHRRRRRLAFGGLGTLVLAVILLIAFWNWDWFLPLVERQASSALGRNVTAAHLHVALGQVTRVTLDDVVIDEPAGFPANPPVARAAHLTVDVGVFDYIRGHGIVIPAIDIDRANANIVGRTDGSNNYTFAFMQPQNPPAKPSTSPPPKIGAVTIENSHVDVAMAKLRAKVGLDVHTTQDQANSAGDRVVVAAKGTYAGQPITGHLVAGALLTLRDAKTPYPIDLQVANGPTRVSLVGTVEDPLAFSGANLRLVFEGPDMSLLYPLTGVPIPATPPYRVAGHLDYTKSRIEFRDFTGRLGTSDLGGTITVDPHLTPPHLTADLHSHDVNLVDLGGFIGAKPGHPTGTREAHAASAQSANVLPTTPISLPKLNAMNVDFAYKGDHIEGRFIPLDDIDVVMTIKNGTVDITRLNFGVGRGTLAGHATLIPAGHALKANAAVSVRDVDLSHLLNATHAFHGTGIVGGGFRLTGTGDSIAALVGHGSGGVELYMRNGGDISSLLPDLLGLEFTNAFLSAIGIPQRTNVDCFVAALPLNDGVLNTRLFVLQTEEARTTGAGDIDFRNDTINYSVTTRSTHFSVGSLPGPINITGKLSSPAIAPGGEIIGRAAGATALGILGGPLAILPTIQFGVGRSEACAQAVGGLEGRGPGVTDAAAATPAVAKAAHPDASQIRRVWRQREHHRAGG
jgi:uncharacterized protein involved in outer membrane biogenesis